MSSAHQQGSLISISGWGGGIRTPECMDQNHVPYRLATPHRKGTLPPPSASWRSDDLAPLVNRLFESDYSKPGAAVPQATLFDRTNNRCLNELIYE